MSASGEPQARRRRRTPAEAEAEILGAAAALLRERPLHGVSVSAIMERTTLSRKSFYVYFRDRYELLTRLFEPLRRELDEANAIFLAQPTGDLIVDGQTSLRVVAEFFAGENGVVVRALHEASAYDEQAARVWREFNEPVIAAFSAQVRREIDAGRVAADIEVDAIVRSLVGMNLFCFFDRIVGEPEADLDAIVTSLSKIWARAFRLADPPPLAGAASDAG